MTSNNRIGGTNTRHGTALGAAVLVAGMAIVVVAVAGFWALAYDPLFFADRNGEVHIYLGPYEVTDFGLFAGAGLFAGLISGTVMALARPLSTPRKRVVSASIGPVVLLLGGAALMLLWQTFLVPFAVVASTSAVASSVGFLGALRLAQEVPSSPR
ncbi:hypothetical protein [Microbacterium flavescens]|uniref:hypothetical protein n=1 Tax=Microbacterium flavescens TaxID=69366 RepID=UPI001BDEBF5A|nr:hypothetical protein [Microbacterium flavescens]